MHMTILALTFANTKEDARSEAETIFERLCENQHPFDYYTTMDTYRATSPKGNALINEGMEWTWREFRANLKHVKEILSCMTEEEIFNENLTKDKEVSFAKKNFVPSIARYYFYQIGKYEGSTIWLYDQDGAGIQHKGHLNDVLNKWESVYKDEKTNPYKGMKLWVTTADVHY